MQTMSIKVKFRWWLMPSAYTVAIASFLIKRDFCKAIDWLFARGTYVEVKQCQS